MKKAKIIYLFVVSLTFIFFDLSGQNSQSKTNDPNLNEFKPENMEAFKEIKTSIGVFNLETTIQFSKKNQYTEYNYTTVDGGTGTFITNKKIDEMMTEKTITKNLTEIVVYPNPFTTYTTIEIKGEVKFNSAEIRIYDLMGREVFRTKIGSKKFLIERDNLKDGIYFYKISDEITTIGTGKIVVQ